jgi:hypothetical protein
MGYPEDTFPAQCNVDEEHLPWAEYDKQSDEDVLAKLARKTRAIRERPSYDEIEDATAAAAAVVNHERQKPENERRKAILDQAYSDWKAGMTAN